MTVGGGVDRRVGAAYRIGYCLLVPSDKLRQPGAVADVRYLTRVQVERRDAGAYHLALDLCILVLAGDLHHLLVCPTLYQQALVSGLQYHVVQEARRD